MMKNIAGMLMLTLSVFACSSTKKDLNSSGRRISPVGDNNGSAVAAISSAGESHTSGNSPVSASPVYASASKVIALEENDALKKTPVAATPVDTHQNEVLNQKVTLAQMEMFRQIEMDKVVSSIALKKVMQRKVYTTEVRTLGDSVSSGTIVSQDTVYSSPEIGEWHPVE